jgi:cytochrome b6-f complex iron-sulfur subunit
MAERKKMSVAEILAAARAADGKGESPAKPADASSADVDTPAEAPAAKPAPAPQPAAGGARPSVADILAAARANKAAAASEPAAAKPAPAAKPAAAAKVAATKPAPSGGRSGVERDTASILAAARAAAKPGPVSKAEAPSRPAAPTKPKEPAAGKPAPKIVPPKPAKPAKPAPKADAVDRRGFLEIATGSFLAVGFSALSVTGGLFTLGLARFMFPNVLAEPPSTFKVGGKEGFPAGKVETKFVAQFGVWVVNGEYEGQQQIYALQTVCTHLGCTPSWLEAEQKFKCPCHGSGFYKDGINFEGPAPRPLERYAIRIADDGQLEVDKSRRFQEELGQWANPESYVSV